MSIKNIIQQENDLQEMSTQSLANYLNNPTGQYNPYLVAGELQRKEAFAQRQMTEAPQGTVVDELVAKTMPMGGMPMGGMPQMPQPRPEEVMVSDTITETGIANLPAPNIGQNYAGGGIVGYENGGDVGYGDLGKDLGKSLLEEAALSKFLGKAYWPATLLGYSSDVAAGTKYEGDELQALVAENSGIDIGDAGAIAGAGVVANAGAKKMAGKTKAPKLTKKGIAAAGIAGIGGVAGKYGSKIKDAITKLGTVKPATTKKLTKKETADFLKEQTKTSSQKALDKANQFKKPSTKGPLTRAGIATLKGIGQGAGPLTKFVGRGLKNYPVETGLGAYGAYKAYDYFDPFGTKQKELEEQLAKEGKDSMEMHRQTRLRREANERVQAELDAQQAAKDKRREKEMYLALALGGAKTMAGQSPFALSNVGEGLGAGVGALAAYDQNEMERMAASQAATAKAQQDMAIALADYTSNYYKGKADLSDEAKAELAALEKEKDELIPEDYVAKKEDIYLRYLGVAPGDYEETINEQTFYAAE